MPRIDWSQASAWDTYYGATVNGQRVSYGRDWAYMEADGFTPEQSGTAQRRDFLIANAMPGLTQADRILIGGCGFGYLIDRFHAAGYPNVWGIDNSTHIENNKNAQAVGDTVWVNDTFTGGGRLLNKLRQLTGDDTFDWIITESVLESYNDNEIAPLLNACETVLASGRPLSAIIHYVFVPPFSPAAQGVFNEKTIDQWNAVRPSHTWVSDTGQVR